MIRLVRSVLTSLTLVPNSVSLVSISAPRDTSAATLEAQSPIRSVRPSGLTSNLSARVLKAPSRSPPLSVSDATKSALASSKLLPSSASAYDAPM